MYSCNGSPKGCERERFGQCKHCDEKLKPVIEWREGRVYHSHDGTRWRFVCRAARDYLPILLQSEDRSMLCGFTESGHYAADDIAHEWDITTAPVVNQVHKTTSRKVRDNLRRIIAEAVELGADDCQPAPHSCPKCEILFLAREARDWLKYDEEENLPIGVESL